MNLKKPGYQKGTHQSLCHTHLDCARQGCSNTIATQRLQNKQAHTKPSFLHGAQSLYKKHESLVEADIIW